MKRIAAWLLVMCVGSVVAQNSVVPPPRDQKLPKGNASELVDKTIKGTAFALPETIVRGAAVLQHQMGQSGAVQALAAAKKISPIVSNAVDGARVLSAYQQEGVEGFKTEFTQVGIERGINAVADVGVGIAVTSAIASGATAVTAGGLAGLVYTGSSLVGGAIRDSTWIGEKFGLEKTIGHKVDEMWWRVSPDLVKEGLSGTPQIDIDSPEVQQRMYVDAARRRRLQAFESVQKENAEQMRQSHAYGAQASTNPSKVVELSGRKACFDGVQQARQLHYASATELGNSTLEEAVQQVNAVCASLPR